MFRTWIYLKVSNKIFDLAGTPVSNVNDHGSGNDSDIDVENYIDLVREDSPVGNTFGRSISPFANVDNENVDVFTSAVETDPEESGISGNTNESVTYLGSGVNNDEVGVINEEIAQLNNVNVVTTNTSGRGTVRFASNVESRRSTARLSSTTSTSTSESEVPLEINADAVPDSASVLTIVSASDSRMSANSNAGTSNRGKKYIPISRFRIVNNNADLDNAAQKFNRYFECARRPGMHLVRRAVDGRIRSYLSDRNARVFKCQCQVNDVNAGLMNPKDVISFQFSHVPDDSIPINNLHVIRVSVHADKVENAIMHFRSLLPFNTDTSGKKRHGG